jgi:hypothetical protein
MSLSASPSDSFTHRSSVVSVESVTTTASSLAVVGTGGFRRNSSFSGRKYPSLEDILGARAPAPFDLAAFLAFAECNHCVEAVEFLMAAEGYRAAYNNSSSNDVDNNKERALWTAWADLVDTFIRPQGAKEVNLTCQARSGLLRLDAEQRQSLDSQQLVRAPNPTALDHSCDVVREMVKDNLYLAFVLSRNSATSAAPSVNNTTRPKRGSDASIASSFDKKEEQRYIMTQPLHPPEALAAPRAGPARVTEFNGPMLTVTESKSSGVSDVSSSAISSGDEAPPLLTSRLSWTHKLSMRFKRRP